ncbi:hypothetical protein AAMO2058_000840600 [Amorphochlora amoebiformis]|mmetsp:Transcript_11070/g.17502  ORF Transcript_11070/g.17502 Transcript_11070/m.17502 type:complete len:388 (-) Transcript_11070:51-1214(-)
MVNTGRARRAQNLLHVIFFLTSQIVAVEGLIIFNDRSWENPHKNASRSLYIHSTAMFGRQQPYNVSGQLVLPADPESRTGCNKLKGSEIRGKVALFIRGGCGFIQKAINAYDAGAVGIVVGDNDPTGNQIWKMIGKAEEQGKNISAVPAVFIQGFAYKEILTRLEKDERLYAVLNATEDIRYKDKMEREVLYPHPRHPLMPFVWLMLGLTYWTRRFFYCLARRHRIPIVREMPLVDYVPLDGDLEEASAASFAAANNSQRPRRSQASTELLNELMQSRTPQHVINPTCTVCFDDFKSGEQLKTLPCGHGFHAACIDPWLVQYNSDRCPICNRSILDPPPNTQITSSAPNSSSNSTPTPQPASSSIFNRAQWLRQIRRWMNRGSRQEP